MMATATTKRRKLLRATVWAVVLGVVAVLTFVALEPAHAPPPPLPVPNGYDTFLEAMGKMSPTHLPPDLRAESTETLREILQANSNAIEILRTGLQHSWRIPEALGVASPQVGSRELMAVRKMAWLLFARGKVAEREERTNDAALCYLEVARFGSEAGRGGLIIQALVSAAAESNGTSALEEVVPVLDRKTAGAASEALVRIDEQREPISDILNSERRWVLTSNPKLERFRTLIPIDGLNPARAIRRSSMDQLNEHRQNSRALIVKLASRAYELDHGKPPATPDVLVPAYLKALPPRPPGTNTAQSSGR